MTGHKLRESYKNSQELFTKKKEKGDQEHPRVWESVFLPPMNISTGIFSTNFF